MKKNRNWGGVTFGYGIVNRFLIHPKEKAKTTRL